MEAKSLLVHSKSASFCVGFNNLSISISFSLRHFSKHLQVTPIKRTSSPLHPNTCFIHHQRRSRVVDGLIKCSVSEATTPEPQTPLLKHLSFDSYDVVKWSAVLSISIAAAKWTAKGVLNPFVWMYLSWSWMFWPWIAALGLAAYGLYCLRKHLRGKANMVEQLAVVTSVLAWLTLVPPAHFNGFLQGWPYVFFLVYHYFFFFNVSVRKRLYGDCYPRPHHPKWDVHLSNWKTLFFCSAVMAAHWLAAFEGPQLHTIPGGLTNLAVWLLILLTLLMQYNSTLYLANYSEKVVVPSTVVQFGPYRWVRHPIYASTMLLFVTYFVALRAPLSLLAVVAVCLWYYDHKAKLEESLMVETFGDVYVEYANKVRYKFIPFLY